MNIWLVTTGSSDVQLKTDERWNQWHQQVRKSYYRLPFAPKQAIEQADAPYRIAPRILGAIYEAFPDQVWPDLMFPLLDAFVPKLQGETIDQILLLVTDQSNIFDEEKQNDLRCPYWQDTSALLPIFELYFQGAFPNAEIIPLFLKPEADSTGLDDWNQVLETVRGEINTATLKAETVYVSHQAGTPAISSAVQFASLAKFGNRVKFLVSSEYRPDQTEFVESSSYLRGIQTEQAKKLLDRYDYAGVQEMIAPYLDDEANSLLEAAIQWNFAKFDQFADVLQNLADQELAAEAKERSQHWWWVGYEEVYLAVVRRNQGNVVEAFFHSFRAFEGIFAAWGKQQFGEYIECIKDIPYLSFLILDDAKDYFSNKRCKDVSDLKNLKNRLENLKIKPAEDVKKDDRIELNMATLCKFFRSSRYKEYKQDCAELKIFWDDDKENNVCEKRNFIVHQIQGMSEEILWNFWGVSTLDEWESRLLKFLNFIASEDLPQEFESLKAASLMGKIHDQLENAIAKL